MTLSRSQRFALRKSTGNRFHTGTPFKLSPVSNVGSLESFVVSVLPPAAPYQTVAEVTARASQFRASTGRVPSSEMVRGWVS
jgi:hypothetical protein